MKTSFLAFLLAGSGVASAATVVADFNDLSAGDLAGQGGGSGFATAAWTNNTPNTPEPDIDVVVGDLVAPAATHYSIAQSGTPRSARNTTGTTSLQTRPLSTPLTGTTIWFSFLINQAAATAPTTGNRGGICFNQATSIQDPGNPRIMALGPRLTAWLSADNQIVIDNAITAGSTALVLGKIQVSLAGNETLSLWVNPDVNALGAPSGTYSAANFVGATGITSVSVQSYGAGAGGTIDALRVSDDPDAYTQVTGSTIPDPVLAIDGGSLANFNFGTLYPGSATRTMSFRNEGPNNSLALQNVTLNNNGGGVFTIDDVTPPVGSTLTPGQTVNVRVRATSAAGGAFNGELFIDTDQNAQDKTLPLIATVIAPGAKVNPNPTMDSGLTSWTTAAAIAPGIAPGSTGMARVRGKGDKGLPLDEQDSLGQSSVPNGAADWELGCHFTPIRAADYDLYGPAPADGTFQDRSFQLAVFTGDDIPATSLAQPQAINSLLQIAYFPAGNGSGPEGFYALDGGTWTHLSGLPAIQGSVDGDSDGLLSGAADNIKDYRLNIRGTGFGSVTASYAVTLSGGELTAPVTQSGIVISAGTLISAATPGSYTFTSSDTSALGNPQAGFCTPFWVDDVFYYAGAMPDSSLTLAGNLAVNGFNQAAPTGTLTLRNDGRTQALDVSNVSFGDPAVTLLSPALPIHLAAGASVNLQLQLDSAAFAPDNGTLSSISLASNDPSLAVASFPLTLCSTTSQNLLPNWNLEAPGTDTAGNTDNFAFWNELDPLRTRDVPGILPGSATAAYLDTTGGSTSLNQTLAAPLQNFELAAGFAVRATANRAFNLLLSTTAGQLNLRYEGSIWSAFDGTVWQPLINMTASPLIASVDSNFDGDFLDPGDSLAAYKLRVTAHGWGTPSPSYQLQILDNSGSVIASAATPFTFFQGGVTTAGLSTVNFTNQNGNSPGFWVDDVKLASIEPGGEIKITAFSANKASGAVSITFTSNAGVAYSIRANNDLSPVFSEVGTTTGNAGSTTVNFTDPAVITQTRRFYRVETP